MNSNYSFNGTSDQQQNEEMLSMQQFSDMEIDYLVGTVDSVILDTISPSMSFDSLSTAGNDVDTSLVEGVSKQDNIQKSSRRLSTSSIDRDQTDQTDESTYSDSQMPPRKITSSDNLKRHRNEKFHAYDAAIIENKNLLKQETEDAKERRRERNRLLAKETRKRNKQDRENLTKEAELLRFQNKMLAQSIREVLDVVGMDVDQSNPTIVAIRDIIQHGGGGEKDKKDNFGALGKVDGDGIYRMLNKKEQSGGGNLNTNKAGEMHHHRQASSSTRK